MHAANFAGVRPAGGFSFLLWHFNIAAAFLATHFFLPAEQALSVACDGVASVRAIRAPARASAMRCMEESSLSGGRRHPRGGWGARSVGVRRAGRKTVRRASRPAEWTDTAPIRSWGLRVKLRHARRTRSAALG